MVELEKMCDMYDIQVIVIPSNLRDKDTYK